MESAAVGIEGFVVISVGRRVLCQDFWASGCLFSIFGLKTRIQKNKNGTVKRHTLFF